MKTLIALTSIFLLCLSSQSIAGKIYKWTDNEGNTHYGERPPSQQAKQIKVRKGPSSAPAPTAKPGNQQEATKKLLDAFDKERKDKKEAATKTAAEKERRDKNCSSAKRRIAGLKFGGRQYEVTEQGERRYLSGTDIQQRTAEAQKVADKWCQ
jgi:FKBP-type peptidyl-prolyl cis-trans isomerase